MVEPRSKPGAVGTGTTAVNDAVVAVIPARGGSKGIAGKNLREVGGVPLLARTIAAARASMRIGRVCVSSDDVAILETAGRCGAMAIVRPAAIATDASASEDAMLHALAVLRRDGSPPAILVLLQCTSPFTSAGEIDSLVAALDDPRFQSALMVTADHSFLWTVNPRGEGEGVNHDPAQPRVVRQGLSAQFRESGQGYAFRVPAFEQSKNRFCPPVALVETSHPPLEIDEPADLKLAEAFAKIVEGSAR